jgi:hypothetical protein
MDGRRLIPIVFLEKNSSLNRKNEDFFPILLYNKKRRADEEEKGGDR